MPLFKNLLRPANSPMNIARNILILVMGLIMLVLGIMFSAVLLGVILVLGGITWIYVWWKTRKLRQAVKEDGFAEQIFTGSAHRSTDNFNNGRVIEGEVIRQHEESRPRINA